MPSTVHCPSCSRELRVPDELIGKKVKCPACSTTFTASIAPEAAAPVGPTGGLEGEAAPPQAVPPAGERAYQEPAGEVYERPRAAGSRSRGLSIIRGPAICLIVTGVLGVLGALYFLISSLVADRGQVIAQMQQNQPPRNAQEREMQEKVLNLMLGPAGLGFHVVSLFINFIIISGGILMLFGKMRGLAYVASILAMVNLDCCCCLLGIPFGIWSLIALSNSDAKVAFQPWMIQ